MINVKKYNKPGPKNEPKVAIVYDRINKWGGAERVLIALHEIYPNAPLFTSVYDKNGASWAKVFPKIYTSPLQKFSFAKKHHQFFGIFMPIIFSRFNFSDYDLVISVTSESAKNINISGKALHICYCLTPTRYLWSHYDLYFRNLFLRFLSIPAVWYLRKVDKKSSTKPHAIIAISTDVKNRIKKYYKRNSEIVFPPVAVGSRIKNIKKRNYYLLVSRLDYGYKKVELAISAFNKMGKKLIIVGTGTEIEKLKKQAKINIKFVGKVSDLRLKNYYQNAMALIMPQDEDFGIVSVEAQSYGIPVIAFGNGGALDTVIANKTGVFFKEQTVEGIEEAVGRFEKMKFKADNLFTNARRFSKEKFKQNFVRIVENERKRRKL